MTDDPEAELSHLTGYNLKRASAVVQADLAGVLTGFGLRAVTYSALRIIVRRPGISQSDVADALGIEKSNLVQLIDDLAGRGLLTRAPVPGDRRRHALMPTDAATRLIEDADGAVAAHEQAVFARLGADEQRELNRLLRLVWVG